MAEQKIRLSIVLLRDHPLPQLLNTKNYIDARFDQGAALRKAVEWVKGRQSVQRLSGLKAPVYLPDYRPQDFVGRERYLARLQDTLTAEPTTFLLHGEPRGEVHAGSAVCLVWSTWRQKDPEITACGLRYAGAPSLQSRVLLLRLLQDRDIRIAVLPEIEKVLVGRPRSAAGGIGLCSARCSRL